MRRMEYTVSSTPPSLLWRIVRTDPPTTVDFLSNEARGLPRRRSVPAELWTGLSAFDDLAIAASVARRFRLGEFLASIDIDPNGPIHWAKTRGDGHYTLWGKPEEVFARVVTIVAVSSVMVEE